MDTQTRTMNQDNDLSPLMTCIKKRDFNAAGTLLKHGADVGVFHERLGSALHLACLTPRVPKDLVQKLISPEVINAPDPVDGNTPLHCVVTKYANLKLVPLLLENNADLNAKNKAGLTPFMTVILEHMKYSDIIAERRHYIREKQRGFLATLPSLITKENIDCVYGEQHSTPLVMTLGNHNFRCAQMLLDHGADPSICNFTDSALHIACRSDNISPEMIQILSTPRSINYVDRHGDTPLHVAVQYNRKLVPMLLKKNADCNLRDNQGRTPLIHALLHELEYDKPCYRDTSNYIDFVKLLIAHTNVDTQESSGMTPLVVAITSRYLHPADDVILRLCTPRTVCWPRRPPLYAAVKRGRWDLVPLLIARGADPNQTWELQGRPPRGHVTPLLCTFVDAHNDGLPGERCEPPPLAIYRQLITPENVDTLYKGKCAVQYASENKQWEVIGLLIRCGLLKTGSLKLLSALAVRVKVLPEHPVPVQFKKYLEMDRLLKDYVRKEDSANANNAQ